MQYELMVVKQKLLSYLMMNYLTSKLTPFFLKLDFLKVDFLLGISPASEY
jgi:hypothetical protein